MDGSRSGEFGAKEMIQVPWGPDAPEEGIFKAGGIGSTGGPTPSSLPPSLAAAPTHPLVRPPGTVCEREGVWRSGGV